MAIATAATGVAIGGAKFFEGRKQQRDAEKAIANFEFQDLTNPFENEQVSTLGADLVTEQSNIGASNATEALRTGGTRGLANIAKVEAQRNIVARQNAANLDQQQVAINTRKAQQAVKNQDTIEQRQNNELAGYGQMMNVGLGMKYQGMDNAINAVGAFGQSAAGEWIDGEIMGTNE